MENEENCHIYIYMMRIIRRLYAYFAGAHESCCNTTLPFAPAHRLFNFHQWPDTFVVYHLQVLASN